jgi:hypothetical protein
VDTYRVEKSFFGKCLERLTSFTRDNRHMKMSFAWSLVRAENRIPHLSQGSMGRRKAGFRYRNGGAAANCITDYAFPTPRAFSQGIGCPR